MQSFKRHTSDVNDDGKSKKVKYDHTLEQDFINYLSVPPLESMAIVNIATAICKQSDVMDAIMEHHTKWNNTVGDSVRKSLNEMNKILCKKVHLLPLPNVLKLELSNAIQPVAKQILGWLRNNCEGIVREHFDFESINWTNGGIIDEVKTFENFIDCSQLTYILFKKACAHCLEASISHLYEKLEEVTKEKLLLSTFAYKNYDRHIFAYWTCVINNRLPMFMSNIKAFDRNSIYDCSHSVYKNMFTLAVGEGNILAVKYFWKKLNFEEKNANLAQWLHTSIHRVKKYDTTYEYTNPFVSMFFFLLSKLTDTEQQREIFQKHSKVILLSLFNEWPWRRFLLPTIQVMWDFLDETIYGQLLIGIGFDIEEGKTTQKLLKKLWRDSPIGLKICFVQYIANSPDYHADIISNLLAVEDTGTVKEILVYANDEEKKQILFSVINSSKFDAMCLAKLTLFIVLVEEMVSSESDIRNLKEKIVQKNGNDLCRHWILADNWQKVEEFLNWAFSSPDQVDSFKNFIINRNQITYCLLEQGNYELVDRFLYWCCGSEQKINQFKKDFVVSESNYGTILNLGRDDWCSFENFLSWCFSSEEEINEFKENVLNYSRLEHFIFSKIKFEYLFEFVDKLIRWCCVSNEVTKHFKNKLVLSEGWMFALGRFVGNYKVYDSVWNNWILLKKIIKLFSPLEEDLKVELKAKIEEKMDFENFYWDFREVSFPIKVKHLFRLLDDDEYSITDSSSSDDCSNDDEYIGSDEDCDKSHNYDEAASAVLMEMINKVESVNFIKATN